MRGYPDDTGQPEDPSYSGDGARAVMVGGDPEEDPADKYEERVKFVPPAGEKHLRTQGCNSHGQFHHKEPDNNVVNGEGGRPDVEGIEDGVDEREEDENGDNNLEHPVLND